ncbi:hypothetical protein RJ639_024377 [Escallonia herrerae]|uniref:Uncharacterized protein n=1 Tax=Escallonia herrerae TaxID=1293975 RepID=A0AA88V087_9ASTE|nr:hypothetical protein RJ639_024377 [Escallonia herrerae]
MPSELQMQVPFLSLNLHALVEQLSKVDLAQRLFTEADLSSTETVCVVSPLELYAGELQASWKQGSCQDQATRGSIDAKKDSDELASSYLVDRNRQAIQPFEVTSSDNTITSSHPVPDIGNENSNSINHDEDGLWEVGRAGKMLAPAAEIDTGAHLETWLIGIGKPFNLLRLHHLTTPSPAAIQFQTLGMKIRTPSIMMRMDCGKLAELAKCSRLQLRLIQVANHRFEAAAAEAELDMLLDSFNETKFLGISGVTSYASQGRCREEYHLINCLPKTQVHPNLH